MVERTVHAGVCAPNSPAVSSALCGMWDRGMHSAGQKVGDYAAKCFFFFFFQLHLSSLLLVNLQCFQIPLLLHYITIISLFCSM